MQSPDATIVTGVGGFIGFHVASRLCSEGIRVIGIDNLNDYYDVSLKQSRIEILKSYPSFEFHKTDITDKASLDRIFQNSQSAYVVHLAAQAGVRYSLTNPEAYLQSNLQGFLNVLEACRHNKTKHLIYASSSSVYGANTKMPFSVHDNVDHPISLYAATKKSNELMAHTYSALFNLPTTGLRFFTVYGPYGRPDMSMFLFTKAILEGKPINVFNQGNMRRDFTYVDDIVEAIVRLIPNSAQPSRKWDSGQPDAATSFAPYRIYNIGNTRPIELMSVIELIEKKLNKKAVKNFMPIQAGDVPATCADIEDLRNDIGFNPSTPIEVGVGKFIDWFLHYYKIKR